MKPRIKEAQRRSKGTLSQGQGGPPEFALADSTKRTPDKLLRIPWLLRKYLITVARNVVDIFHREAGRREGGVRFLKLLGAPTSLLLGVSAQGSKRFIEWLCAAAAAASHSGAFGLWQWCGDAFLPLREKKETHGLSRNCQEGLSAIFLLLFGNKIPKEPQYVGLGSFRCECQQN